MYEAAIAADHQHAMRLSSSSAGEASISQNQGISGDSLGACGIIAYCRSEEPVAAWPKLC